MTVEIRIGGALSNVALNQPATQSSEGWGGVAARGVDGNNNGDWGGGSCTHTQNGATEWWQVDLGAPYAITEWRSRWCCSSAQTHGRSAARRRCARPAAGRAAHGSSSTGLREVGAGEGAWGREGSARLAALQVG